MKIDPINKTITFDCYDNLGKMIEALEQLYPNGEWRQFTVPGTYYIPQYTTYSSNDFCKNIHCDIHNTE